MPPGFGFAPGSSIRSLTDCKCPYGMQPSGAGSTGLDGGCVECPRSQYKASVEDSSCQSCGLGLTTQQTGAISAHACTCAAGSYITVPNDPTSCQTCGKGYYCHGAAHREACAENQTTLADVTTASEDCVCAEGHSRSASGCPPCAPGSFKVEAGNGDCEACPKGTWSNATGVAQRTCASDAYQDRPRIPREPGMRTAAFARGQGMNFCAPLARCAACRFKVSNFERDIGLPSPVVTVLGQCPSPTLPKKE